TSQGVEKITSTSLQSVSSIIVQFKLDTDITAATADVRSKIEQARLSLPSTIEPPVVQQFDPSAMPILSLALSSKTHSVGELTAIADGQLKRDLEGVGGVGRVEINGSVRREIDVLLPSERMEALNISVQQVIAALGQQNLEIPAGRVEMQNREQLVRVVGRITSPEQFGALVVAQRPEGAVHLGQVAQIHDATEVPKSMAFLNGKPAIGMDILKVSGANTVQVAEGVRSVVEHLAPTLGKDVTLTVVRDNSVAIRASVESVEHELLLGALLTVLVVFLFLNDGRATVITALSLPVSVISAFILMGALHFTLNILTLMALSLSIGLLIDDAIVVIESIVRRRDGGEDAFTAAYHGTHEIFLAVMATTLTIVAVFVPVAFMGGIIGKFFFQFGITVAWAVLVSLFVSFTLTPMMSAWWTGRTGSHGPSAPARKGPVASFNRAFDRIAMRYRSVLTWVLAHRKTTVLVAILSLVLALALFPLVGGPNMPTVDNGEFIVNYSTPSGSSLSYTAAKGREIGAMMRGLEGVSYTYTTIGSGATGSITDGSIYVRLVPRHDRPLSQQDLMESARKSLATVYRAETTVLDPQSPAKPIQIVVSGPDIVQLRSIVERVVGAVKSVPGAVEVATSLGAPRPEIRLNVDMYRANQLGLNAAMIAATVQPLLSGQRATTWEDPSGTERQVIVQLPPEERTTPERIARMPLSTFYSGPMGAATHTTLLGEVVHVQRGTGPSQIDREDLSRVANVSANLDQGASLSEVSALVQQRLGAIELPRGYAVRVGGDTKQMTETAGFVAESILLAIILIYLILASQFASFTQPFSIMLALPLSLCGVMLALLITRDTVNTMSMIGVIMLLGLVTKNAILLIDNANHHRLEGLPINEAIIEAGEARLRPIVMTTIAMICGMLPIAFGGGEGGQFRAPMA
ncbi:MAG: efflux RND transporter permease subunit, partial [Acidobacteriota bacterium]|nr:efflux RND transporter permease subunit [Acidobacteriota bacterium]